MKLTVHNKALLAYSVAALLVVAVSASSYLAMKSSIEGESWVHHTREVSEKLYELSGLFNQVSSNTRGYFISGQDYYLKHRQAAFEAIPNSLRELHTLTADNPAQQRRLDQLDAEIAGRFKNWEVVSDLYRRKGLSAIQERIRGSEVKLREESRDKLIQEMIDEESQALARRMSDSRVRTQRALETLLFGSAIAILLVLFSTLQVARHTRVRREAETSLAETMETLQTLIRSSPAGILVLDDHLAIRLWSPACQAMFGWSEAEILGKPIPFVPAEGFPQLKQAVESMASTGKPLEIELGGHRKDGTAIKIGILATPLSKAEYPGHSYMAVLTDVTASARINEQLESAAEQAFRASQMKSQFLANMSHEIRTPINGVIGMNGLLLDSELDPEQREYAEAVRLSADTLLSIINDVLDFSKIEAGKLELDPVEFDLRQLVTDVQRTLLFSAQKKNLPLVTGGLLDWPRNFVGDPARIRQVLTNLVSNAIKFTTTGKVELRLLQQSDAESTTTFRFEVEDTGIGIPTDASDKMFQAFTQADATVSRRFGGTGLGLSISKRLVHLMGGEIGFESVEGKGSTFWFTLTLSKGSPIASSPKAVEVATKILASGHRPFRILVAEDNWINQRITLAQLKDLGFRADAVVNGSEAIDALRAIPYDLVLMDCRMPELDGYEATRLIRKSKTMAFKDVVIIAMTASAIKGEQEKCLAAGMNDFITKPVSTDLLRRVLEGWVRKIEKRKAQSPSMPAYLPPLDAKVLADLAKLSVGQDTRLVDELGSAFLRLTPGRLSRMEQASLAGSHQVIRDEAHQLKASSGNLGALAMSRICEELEGMEGASAAQFGEILGRLRAEFERVSQAIGAEIRKAA